MAAMRITDAARHLPATLAAAALLALAPAVHAQVWNEVGDAGASIAGAQATIGVGTLTTINGSLAAPADVDLYCVTVGPTPAAIGLPVVTLLCAVDSGPEVWVFDSNGVGVATNQSCSTGGKRVTTTLLSPGSPTVIYVAVSYSGVAPQSPGGAIWSSPQLGEGVPNGPGAAGALNGWAGTGVVQPLNPYQLTFGFTSYCDAATPAARPSWGTLKIRHGL